MARNYTIGSHTVPTQHNNLTLSVDHDGPLGDHKLRYNTLTRKLALLFDVNWGTGNEALISRFIVSNFSIDRSCNQNVCHKLLRETGVAGALGLADGHHCAVMPACLCFFFIYHKDFDLLVVFWKECFCIPERFLRLRLNFTAFCDVKSCNVVQLIETCCCCCY